MLGAFAFAALVGFTETYSGEASVPALPATFSGTGLACVLGGLALAGTILLGTRPSIGAAVCAVTVLLSFSWLALWFPGGFDTSSFIMWLILWTPLMGASLAALAGRLAGNLSRPKPDRLAVAGVCLAVLGGLLSVLVVYLLYTDVEGGPARVWLVLLAGSLAVCCGLAMLDWPIVGAAGCVLAVCLAFLPLLLLPESNTSGEAGRALSLATSLDTAIMAAPILLGCLMEGISLGRRHESMRR